MSLRRKYSLPGCTLILEGLTTESDRRRPTLSAVVNAQCHIHGQSETLSGGQGFLKQLTETLSAYTQNLLSGIAPATAAGYIQIEPLPPLHHHLTIRDPEVDAPVSLKLTTPQLFDLLESLDQMLADACTLPGWSLELQPLTRQQARLDQPLAERATPAAIGISGLAVAASVLFFLPIPEVERPTDSVPASADAVTATSGDGVGAAPPSASDVEADGFEADPTLEGEVDIDAGDRPEAKDLDTETDTDRETKPDTDEADRAGEQDSDLKDEAADDTDTDREAITDSDQLYALNLKLEQDLSDAWDSDTPPSGDREYRVTVGRDGAIVGYAGRSDAAQTYEDSTPLPDLLYVPTPNARDRAETQADFRVVFSEAGTLEVSPWNGYADEPGDPPTLTDADTVERSFDDLSDTLYDKFTGEPSFDRELAYRLGVTTDGTLASVESLDADARSFYGETPLPDLYDPAAAIAIKDGQVGLTPLVEFRVVFKPSGVIEIAPWYDVQ